MNMIKPFKIIITLTFAMVNLIIFGQNKLELNDSIKSVYSSEYNTIFEVLELICNEEYSPVFKLLSGDINKKEYKKRFKELNEFLSINDFSKNSKIYVKEIYLKAPTLNLQSERLLKIVRFEIIIPDISLPDYNNIIWIDFSSDKEKDFEIKSHDYQLDKIDFRSAKEDKEINETMPALPVIPVNN